MWQQEKKYSLIAFLNLLGTLNVFMADDDSNSVELVGLVYVDDSDSDSDEEWKPRRNQLCSNSSKHSIAMARKVLSLKIKKGSFLFFQPLGHA